MFKKSTLKNGLRIITIPLKNTKAVTILILVGTGSKYETKEIKGISHFLEHMFFKGTKTRLSQLKVAETLDRVGGAYTAFTSQDCTGYWVKVLASHFDLALDWTSDIFLNSLFPVQEIKKEKGVIIEEINMYLDNPTWRAGDLWHELLYGDQPAGWNIAGTKESVSGINRKKLIDYMNQQYVASNTIVCIAGNIREKEIPKKVEKYFSKIKSTPFFQKQRVLEKQQGPSCVLEEKKTDQVHLCLGVRAYNLFHNQRYAQNILGAILGRMMSSRLYIEVVDKLGIAYYISTSTSSNPDTGHLVTQAGVNSKKIEKGISVILKEYKKISQKKVSRSELDKAKENIKGRMALALETSDSQASFFANQELLKGKMLTPEQVFEKINAVSSNDILRVAQDIFRPEKLNLALIGPFKEKTRFEKLLKI